MVEKIVDEASEEFKVSVIKGKTHETHNVGYFMREIRKELNKNPDVLMLPEYALFSGKPETSDLNANIRKITEWSKKHSDTLIVGGSYIKKEGTSFYNRVPLIKNGEVSFYDKKNICDMDYDIASANGGGTFKRKHKTNVINHNKKRIGLEVCLDHCDWDKKSGTLKDPVDVHLVVGCDAQLMDARSAAKDGYIVLADGFDANGHEVRQYSDGSRVDSLNPIEESKNIAKYKLTFKK